MYYFLVGLGGALVGWVIGETIHMSVVNSLELKLKALEKNVVSDAKAVISVVRAHLGL
jgi:hypothetical protein